MDPKRNEPTIETLLNVRERDVLLQRDCRSSPCVVYVADDIVAGQAQSFVLYLLQKNDVQVLTSDEHLESFDFSCVGDRVDVYRSYFVVCVIHL